MELRLEELTLNTDSAAKLLHCSKTTILKLTKSGELPYARIGREYIYITEDIVNYIRSRYSTIKLVAQDNDKEILCQSLSAKIPKYGKSSSTSMDKEYAKALGLETKPKQNSRRQH